MQEINYRFCPQCGGRLEERLLKPREPKRLVCAACGFVFYLDPKLAVLALIPLDGGIVLVRRSIDPGYGLWVAPGGFVDLGETVPEAVVREAGEECGLTVEVERLLNVYSYRTSRTVVVAYLTRYVAGEVAAGDEELEARIFAPREIPWDEIAFTSSRQALQEYLALGGTEGI
jgi:ADP-ribose pyrophosphatase YjhB (NUDIX family)